LCIVVRYQSDASGMSARRARAGRSREMFELVNKTAKTHEFENDVLAPEWEKVLWAQTLARTRPIPANHSRSCIQRASLVVVLGPLLPVCGCALSDDVTVSSGAAKLGRPTSKHTTQRRHRHVARGLPNTVHTCQHYPPATTMRMPLLASSTHTYHTPPQEPRRYEVGSRPGPALPPHRSATLPWPGP
jgi:hypothetical protein